MGAIYTFRTRQRSTPNLLPQPSPAEILLTPQKSFPSTTQNTTNFGVAGSIRGPEAWPHLPLFLATLAPF